MNRHSDFKGHLIIDFQNSTYHEVAHPGSEMKKTILEERHTAFIVPRSTVQAWFKPLQEAMPLVELLEILNSVIAPEKLRTMIGQAFRPLRHAHESILTGAEEFEEPSSPADIFFEPDPDYSPDLPAKDQVCFIQVVAFRARQDFKAQDAEHSEAIFKAQTQLLQHHLSHVFGPAVVQLMPTDYDAFFKQHKMPYAQVADLCETLDCSHQLTNSLTPGSVKVAPRSLCQRL